MKISISFSIDARLVELLKKEKDKNALINSYLIHYFGLDKTDSEKAEQE